MAEKDLEYLNADADTIYQQAQTNPGIGIPVDPDVADHMGAFEDDAITEEDALESRIGVDENGVCIGEDDNG